MTTLIIVLLLGFVAVWAVAGWSLYTQRIPPTPTTTPAYLTDCDPGDETD